MSHLPIALHTNMERNLKEALNLARLNHQNIVKVLESFEENNTYYYVMEYIEGSSLDAYILEKGGLPEKKRYNM